MPDIATYLSLREELDPTDTTIIAVSKLKPVVDIQALYDAGHRDFGENYVQEMVEKQEQLPQDTHWHFIGHLQRNKVKYIASFVHLIHSVDSFKLLREINKQAQKYDRVIDVLLQVYVGDEATKFGLDEKETMELLEYYDAQKSSLQHVRIRGLMGMASFVDDQSIVRKEFNTITQMFFVLKNQFFLADEYFNIRSMGMSGDYKIAVAEKSNMVRIGSTIFGDRV